MKPTFALFVLSMLAVTLASASEPTSFVDQDQPDVGRIQRHLLEANDQDSAAADATPSSDADDAAAYTSEIQYGPELFYDGKNFLMRVDAPGILVSVYTAGDGADGKGAKLDQIRLNRAAKSVTGSMINSNGSLFMVSLDWKTESFVGEGSLKIESMMLKMTFEKTDKEYVMTEMEAAQVAIGQETLPKANLRATTKFGYAVKAPLGLAFCCDEPGMFSPVTNDGDSDDGAKYQIGVTLPGLSLQVFDVPDTRFGPSWYCGELLGIGLLVGLLLSLFFAVVIFMAVTMLGNISTPDRFDDPKGKQIHVPQTE